MPKKETLIWTALALCDRTELFYSFADKDEAIFVDEVIDEITDSLASGTPTGKQGCVAGTWERTVSGNIILVYDRKNGQTRILRILFSEALPKRNIQEHA